MKNVFSKLDFPEAPGGNLYEWKEAATHFAAAKTGLHIIKIVARAKNANQNQSTDDDDLRIALDGFNFGKYERRKDKISWKGYGTSAAWDGAGLKSMLLSVSTKSAKEKGGTDGDNLKIVVNGKILKNPTASRVTRILT